MQASIQTVILNNGKPMSVNLYSQLPAGRLIVNMQMAGTPWGRVNRHDPDCKGQYPHEHVLWQTETGELMRDRVFTPEGASIDGPAVTELLDAMAAHGLFRGRGWRDVAGIDLHMPLHFGRDAITVHGVRFVGRWDVYSYPPDQRDRGGSPSSRIGRSSTTWTHSTHPSTTSCGSRS